MENNERISRHTYFLEVAKLTSRRSTCPKKSVGAVLVRDGRIIATGYNGVLPNMPHDLGMDSFGNTHTVHAESNIIAFCAKEGISTKGATLYVTLSPCEKCAELIVQAGITKVFYVEQYRDNTGLLILKSQNIETLPTL